MIGLGIFYVFVSYMFVSGWGLTGSAQPVADQFEGKHASAFYPLTDRFVGAGLTTMVEILIITSSFACSMAFYNTGSRYVFSLARAGVLPRALGRTHPTKRGPVAASMLVSGIIPSRRLIAPVIGFLAMAGACYLLIDNRAALSGAGDALHIKLVPWVVLAVFLIGCAAALWMRRRAKERYLAD